MVTYLNYSNTTNITGFASALDYSNNVMQVATGYNDAFGLAVIATVFLGFYIIGSRYTQERALLYSSFMTTIAAFVLVSGNFLNPNWLILSIIGTIAAAYFTNRMG